MAQKILIMGESGTGKTTSLRNCNPKKTAIINPVAKPLPFRGKFHSLDGVTDADKIIIAMREAAKAGIKIIVVDDFQYILSIPYMNRIKEAGWDKWNDFGDNYFRIIDECSRLPEDVNVYFLTHTETLEDGTTTIKLIGKLLREKITIEGLFTTVLRTQVVDGKYYFLTQNSGKDTVKSPLGMFDTYAIENDLNYVDEKIRNYYGMEGAKSDAEIKKADVAAAAPEIEKPEGGRRSRTARTKREEPKPTNLDEILDEEIPDIPDDELPFSMEEPKEEQPKRRTRKVRN